MSQMTLPQYDTSYGIYTIERLPKGSKRTPKWDLHSTAQDRETAENHARILASQPYFDYIEIKEFRVCKDTQERLVKKIKSYSRESRRYWIMAALILAAGLIAANLIF